MANKVRIPKGKEFHFPETTSRSAVSQYPWDAWFNGEVLQLDQSVPDVSFSDPANEVEGGKDKWGTVVKVAEERDFSASMSAMMYKIKAAARKRYKVVQTSRKNYEGEFMPTGIIIRARDMTPEERQAEDVLRLKEKAEKKLKAAQKAAGNGADSDAGSDEAE